MNINFICRASKARRDGQSPIEMSVIINGERTIIALDRKCKSTDFNPKTQKVRGDKETNEYLVAMRNKCFQIETEMIKKSMTVTLSNFMDVYKNGWRDTRVTLLQLFKKHNDEFKKKVDAGVVIEKTYERYNNTMDKIIDYLDTLGKKDIPMTEVTPSFIEGFQTYCLGKLKVGTTNKNLKHLKKIIVLAIDEGIIKVNPFRIQMREEKLDYQPLSKEELNRIKNKKIENERLSNVRDLFLFQCHTGLSFCDMSSFTREDIDGDMIMKNRKKTSVKSVIPILPEARRILEKYNYELPTLSNQKYNSYLAEIKDICNIDKKITSHLSRHTFATILINNSIDIEVIAKILGHSSSAITRKVYAQFLDTTVKDNATKIANAFAL